MGGTTRRGFLGTAAAAGAGGGIGLGVP
ncbi:twin-arginine translocation signal domain-containing protein, partial [Streptomyces scabiei]